MFSVTEKFDRIARHNGVYVYPVESGVEIWETPYYLGRSFYKIFHPVKESERVQVGFVSWRVIEAGLCDWEDVIDCICSNHEKRTAINEKLTANKKIETAFR